MGTFTAPNSNSVMSSVQKKQLGQAGGWIGLARNFGFIFGIALSSGLFEFFRDSGNSYVSSMNYTYFVFVIIALIGLTFSISRGLDPYLSNQKS